VLLWHQIQAFSFISSNQHQDKVFFFPQYVSVLSTVETLKWVSTKDNYNYNSIMNYRKIVTLLSSISNEVFYTFYWRLTSSGLITKESMVKEQLDNKFLPNWIQNKKYTFTSKLKPDSWDSKLLLNIDAQKALDKNILNIFNWIYPDFKDIDSVIQQNWHIKPSDKAKLTKLSISIINRLAILIDKDIDVWVLSLEIKRMFEESSLSGLSDWIVWFFQQCLEPTFKMKNIPTIKIMEILKKTFPKEQIKEIMIWLKK
jgi:hypothetical protein